LFPLPIKRLSCFVFLLQVPALGHDRLMSSLLGLVTADLSKQALTAIAQCAAAAATAAAAPPAALAQTINGFLQQAGAPASQAQVQCVCAAAAGQSVRVFDNGHQK
jgi:hypothetical protein